jgi:crotonobetainyl-CoA hydratase
VQGPPVLVERRGRIVVITLNRPAVHNAVNADVSDAVGAALQAAEGDPTVGAVVITGAGPSFCAGADLKSLANGESVFSRRRPDWGFAGYTHHYISKPTIAAVNGPALGGGTEIVLASDLAVASHSAVFALPEVKHGLVAAGGGAFRLPRQLPPKIGLAMVLTGDPLTAPAALGYGLVNDVVEHDVLAAACQLARRICDNSAFAVQWSKRLAWRAASTWSREDADWVLNAQAIETFAKEPQL